VVFRLLCLALLESKEDEHDKANIFTFALPLADDLCSQPALCLFEGPAMSCKAALRGVSVTRRVGVSRVQVEVPFLRTIFLIELNSDQVCSMLLGEAERDSKIF
jgi:hypothetical protein